MTNPGPSRHGTDLADVVEMLLDKGVVINADIAVFIGDTQLLGIHLRAAIASFETAAQYGLAFPEGADTERIEQIAGVPRHSLASSSDDGDDEDPYGRARHKRKEVPLRPTARRTGASKSEDSQAESAGETGEVESTREAGEADGVDAGTVDLDDTETEDRDEESTQDDAEESTADDAEERTDDDSETEDQADEPTADDPEESTPENAEEGDS